MPCRTGFAGDSGGTTIREMNLSLLSFIFVISSGQGKRGGKVLIYELEDTTKVFELFKGWQETLIYSCLQKVMGKIFDEVGNKV